MLTTKFLFAILALGWVLLLVRVALLTRPPPSEARLRTAGRTNVLALLVGIAAGFVGMAIPVVELVHAFDEVAHAAPEAREALLSTRIDETMDGSRGFFGFGALVGIAAIVAVIWGNVRRSRFSDPQLPVPVSQPPEARSAGAPPTP